MHLLSPYDWENDMQTQKWSHFDTDNNYTLEGLWEAGKLMTLQEAEADAEDHDGLDTWNSHISMPAGTKIVVCDVEEGDDDEGRILTPFVIITFDKDGEIWSPDGGLTTDLYLWAVEDGMYYPFGGEPVEITDELKDEDPEWDKEAAAKIMQLNPTHVLYQM